MAELMQFLLSGVTVGAVYALVALGFTIIYNASDVVNFAQGEFVMLGGMITVFAHMAGLPLPLAALIAIAGTAAVGVALNKLAIEPARGAPRRLAHHHHHRRLDLHPRRRAARLRQAAPPLPGLLRRHPDPDPRRHHPAAVALGPRRRHRRLRRPLDLLHQDAHRPRRPRHLQQPPGGAARRHQHQLGDDPLLRALRRHRRARGRPRHPDHQHQLRRRHRLRPQGLRRRHARRHGQPDRRARRRHPPRPHRGADRRLHLARSTRTPPPSSSSSSSSS